MPIFFFEITHDGQTASDHEGQKFDNLDTAEADAIRAAHEMVLEDVGSRSRRVVVEIFNHLRVPVSTVMADIQVIRRATDTVR